MLFLGVDWGEAHHDLCLLDQDGMVLAARRITDGLAGVLHALVAAHAQDPAEVAVGIETDRGLLVGALLAAGYQVYAVNPQVVSRYRGRHGSSRAKSDRGDAKVLADLVRTDRHNHRQVAGDSPLVEAVKVLARAHQSLVWSRQRHANALRSALREFYPGALAALGAQLAEPAAQDRWIIELVDLAASTGVDGINVDVEGLPLEHVADYGDFVGRLRTALRERLPDAQVSVATPGGSRGAAMAAAAASADADRIFLMGYDYRWEGSNVGATSPLEPGDGEGGGLRASLDLYAALGVPVERTLLGLPLYGMTWPVDGGELFAPATDRGNEWIPRLNLGVFDRPGFSTVYDSLESVEFYAVQGEDGAWNAVYYDSPRSLTPKLALADERGLAGVGFWAIGYERGLPGYTELIDTFRAGELAAVPAASPAP